MTPSDEATASVEVQVLTRDMHKFFVVNFDQITLSLLTRELCKPEYIQKIPSIHSSGWKKDCLIDLRLHFFSH